jgi:hypothetical protein
MIAPCAFWIPESERPRRTLRRRRALPMMTAERTALNRAVALTQKERAA